uniref:NADH dehydrogenase subunit 4L n=1 Tax=Nandigallia matai TaxID=1792639 RepID=UPI003000FFBA|nr:NADH dehydrogenase subunit 4L [Nandigallia matai]
MNLYMCFIVFFMGLFSLVLIRKHVLMCLLCLEFIVLYVLFFIFNFCLSFDYSFYLYVLFMTFYVCEGVLGLSLLVSMIRTHGNDYLSSMLMC